MRRMKQFESVEAFELDIVNFQKDVDSMCSNIRSDALLEFTLQSRTLHWLHSKIAEKKKGADGVLASRYILRLIDRLDLEGRFISGFAKRIARIIQSEYSKELEPFYSGMFNILHPSTQEKVILIQSLERSGGEDAVKLSLTDEEKVRIDMMINLLKIKIMRMMPDVFDCKLIYLTNLIPVKSIFNLSIDNQSLQTLLRLKVVSAKNAKPTLLKDAVVKALIVLNLALHPVPKCSIIQEDVGKTRSPQQAINGPELNRLLESVS